MTDTEPLPPARILDVTPEQYHKLPGLSPSLAQAIHSTCLAKARDKYVRNLETSAAADESEDDAADDDAPAEKVAGEKQKRLERGDVLHALLLGKGKRLEVIPSSKLGKNGAYSTAASKELRDSARAAGRIPIKEPDMVMHARTAEAVRARLAAAGHVLDGVSELAIEWWESTSHGNVQCRTMLDHVVLSAGDEHPTDRPTHAQVHELKFPGDASPDRSERTSDGLGYHLAAAARHRALNALYPSLAGRIEYRFLYCEPFRPYAFWDPTPTGAFLELGLRQWWTAVNMWAAGLRTGNWLGYHDDIMRRQIDLMHWRKLREGFSNEE